MIKFCWFVSDLIGNPEHRLFHDVSSIIYCSFMCVWTTIIMRETHLVFSIVVVQYKSVQCIGEYEINYDKTRLHREKVLRSPKKQMSRHSEFSSTTFFREYLHDVLLILANQFSCLWNRSAPNEQHPNPLLVSMQLLP